MVHRLCVWNIRIEGTLEARERVWQRSWLTEILILKSLNQKTSSWKLKMWRCRECMPMPPFKDFILSDLLKKSSQPSSVALARSRITAASPLAWWMAACILPVADVGGLAIESWSFTALPSKSTGLTMGKWVFTMKIIVCQKIGGETPPFIPENGRCYDHHLTIIYLSFGGWNPYEKLVVEAPLLISNQPQLVSQQGIDHIRISAGSTALVWLLKQQYPIPYPLLKFKIQNIYIWFPVVKTYTWQFKSSTHHNEHNLSPLLYMPFISSFAKMISQIISI